MAHISVNETLCKKDHLCTHVCATGVFSSDGKDSPPHVRQSEGQCAECGHCVAVCPTGAIAHESFPQGSTRPVRPELKPSAEQIEEILKTRRSIREFTDRPVEKQVIQRIIDGARFAPSGCNCQSTEFTVVQDKAVLNEVVRLASRSLSKATRMLHNPAFRAVFRLIARNDLEAGMYALRTFDILVDRYKSGVDVVTWGAPVLLVFHARRGAPTPLENAMLALSNASLTARALGLGDVCVGLIPIAANSDRKVLQLLSIPKGNRVHVALALGYPKYEYKKWVDRKPARVTWI